MAEPRFVPLVFDTLTEEEMRRRARAFHDTLCRRRSVRAFSTRPVPRDIIECAIRTAAAAPSGANRQPWHFVAVSGAGLKHRIREAAEREERAFYAHRATAEWLQALEPLGTDADKPFLEDAPWLIAVFLKKFSFGPDGRKLKNYYTAESVGIACGFLLAALHWAGLATLTHTPSPMRFLNEILQRPATERAFLLLPVGYPAAGATVPAIDREPLQQVATFLD